MHFGAQHDLRPSLFPFAHLGSCFLARGITQPHKSAPSAVKPVRYLARELVRRVPNRPARVEPLAFLGIGQPSLLVDHRGPRAR